MQFEHNGTSPNYSYEVHQWLKIILDTGLVAGMKL
jgi:hypothetical protein